MDTHLALKSCIIFSPSQDTLSDRRTPHPRRKQEEEVLPTRCSTWYSIQVSVPSLTSAWPGNACGEWGLIAEIHYYDLLLRDADLLTAVHNGQLFYCILSISTAPFICLNTSPTGRFFSLTRFLRQGETV